VGNPLCFPGNLASKLIDASGFTLTDGQLKAIAEIASDQRSNKRMLRLLQGDVGSGKTIVAACAVLNAIEAGKQAAIVAPTDLLASQHFGYITSLCQSLEGVRIEILTGKTTSSKRRTILKDLSEGKINLVIGTHAVFQHDVIFKDLGLVVIDEQHRFGVEQRMALINKGDKADVLAMSATPIPRTLSLAIYKDMHVSILQDKPYSNSSITTYTKLDSKIEEVLAFMKAKLDLSEQIYWVCPLIEHDEESSDTSAKIRFEHLKKVFGDSVGLLHGKLLQKEKDVIMSEFVEGKLSVLVATTVIEVGIDVKNATLMVIEQAERFGLAQLHQLRGRVGRSSKPSTCILLFSRNIGEIARQRLEIIKKSNNGFLIAEQDFKLRGGGEILGTKQSGLPEFRVASLDLHYDLLLEASQYADQERIDERTSVLLRLFGYDAAARLVHAS
jgi:ATP-dependent DNA helicase RecG